MKRGRLSRHERVFYIAAMLQMWAGITLMIFGVISLAVGILVATLGILGTARIYRDRAQYNAGWTCGRMAMFASLAEAQHRGMHPIEWMIAEAERDGFEVTIEGDLPNGQ